MLYIGRLWNTVQFGIHHCVVVVNYASQAVGRHFNSATHVVSDIKSENLCPISGNEMHLISKLETIYIHPDIKEH